MCVHTCNSLLLPREICQSDGLASRVSASSSIIVLITVLSEKEKKTFKVIYRDFLAKYPLKSIGVSWVFLLY